jgi:hypothetical protein
MSELALKYESRTMTHEELMALPVSFSLATGAKAFGIGRTLAYELHRKGEFPCRVLKIGNSLKVTRADLFRALGMADEPVSGEHTQVFAQAG